MTLLIVLALVAAAVIAFAIVKKRNVEVLKQTQIEVLEPVASIKKELTLKPKKEAVEKKAEVKEKKPKSKKTTKKEK